MKWLTRGLLACGLAAAAAQGWAATATTTFIVSGTVVPGCSVTATAMSFGAAIPNPITANIDAASTVTATCSTGTPWTVDLNVGTGAGATFAVRRMTSGGSTMNYSLYTNAGRTTVWGDGTGGTSEATGVGTGAGQAITVFGRIPPQALASSGAYTDTITVTILF